MESSSLMSANAVMAPTEILHQSLLSPPTADLTQLWDLGVAGIATPQYLRWAEDLGVFKVLCARDETHVHEILENTALSERGVDAIFGILCSLQLAQRTEHGFRLTPTARQYLDRNSSYYVGGALYGMHKRRIPTGLRNGEKPRRFSQITHTFWYWLRFVKKSAFFWGKPDRLLVQHARNLPAASVGATSRHFQGIKKLVDIGGGSGVFAIPLSLRYPQMHISLMELPRVVPNIRMFLEPYGLAEKIDLVGHDMHETPWPLNGYDAVLLANMLHFCDDEECLVILRECYRLLPSNGRVIVHEMLWNDGKDGPLVTAFWNFWLISVSAGRQRTKSEFIELFRAAGFDFPDIEETCGGFSLLVVRKP